MFKRISMLAGVVASLAIGCAAHAAVVTYVGTQADLGSGWRTASVAKPLDIDANNVLGSHGWYVTGNYIDPNDHQTPWYFSTLNMGAAEYPGNGSYILIDNPNTTPGATPSTIRTGTKNPFPGTGNESTVLSFGVNSFVPATFRVGVMIDNLDNAGYNPNGMRVAQQSGPGNSGPLTWNPGTEPNRYNRNPDWLFFDVTGAQAGDVFDVISTGGPNGCAAAGAFAFDAVGGPPSWPPIQAGDVIKLDFSNAGDGDGGSLFDWNQTTNAVAPITPGNVIRHGDGAVVGGVGISFSGGGGGYNNDGASGNWPGTAADPYYILAADDIYYGPGALTTTFSGLDPNLLYNVRIYNLIGNNPGAIERFTVTDGAGTQSVDTARGARWAAPTLEAGGSVFTGLSPNALGQINVTVRNIAAGGGYYPLNAIVLEAVATVIPEPSALLIWSLLAGLAVAVAWRRKNRQVLTGLAIVEVLGLAGPAQAAWVDDFDASTFDARWGFDIPTPSLASITLDTGGQQAQFTTTGNTDMWTTRNNAPILWTPTPTSGGYSMETHVLASTSAGGLVTGLTVYGTGGADDGTKPNFSFGLDHWNVNNRVVKIQGLGNNNPQTSVSATGGEAWLRLDYTPEPSGVDQYRALYKLNQADPWTGLYALNRDVDNARMGLFLKTSNTGRTTNFDYAALTELPDPNRTWDFESGLAGWNVVTAGVPGDNQVFTTPGNQPAILPHSGNFDDNTIQGNAWIRTWEGEVLGTSDAHTGVIETDSFVLGPKASFSLLVGGGNHPFTGDPDLIASGISAVNLERQVAPGDWDVLFTATGRSANYMFPVLWDASAFTGETVRLRIYDTHTGGWGHIDVDAIQYFELPNLVIPEPAALLIWSLLAGLGIGAGWRRRKR